MNDGRLRGVLRCLNVAQWYEGQLSGVAGSAGDARQETQHKET
ncbi:hypothetical protein K788_0008580 (plasmid) [Paraburkholderia caribensis MBA4]|uniref:Uncharacterized protein n=1 Tax=Paraburkholderia caribensis MBA4 TaxID=1323664 RepID=A0A0P0RPD5_9BURK|nr:hypothetical protein K788_0008580 [Paraburkholderia caribensis MBA4]